MLGVLPDLGAGRAIVRRRILGVIVLVGVKRIRRFLGYAFCRGDIVVGRAGLGRRRTDDDVGPQTLQITHLFGRRLFRQHKYALIAAYGRDQCETDAGVARCRLDDRAALFQDALALGPVDHRDADAVLDRISGVQTLHLGVDRRLDLELLCNIVDPYERRFADQSENVVIKFHLYKNGRAITISNSRIRIAARQSLF